MIYFLDAAQVPDAATLARIRARGWDGWAGYLGGPRAAHAYTADEWQRVAAAGFGLLGIYVGRNVSDRPGETWDTAADFTAENGQREAANALDIMRLMGFPSWAPICLDVEYATGHSLGAELDTYLSAFGKVVNADTRQFGLYSDSATLGRYGPDVVDLKWGAEWTGQFTADPPTGAYDPASPPPWDAWQFAGGLIEGASVDVSSARDTFPFATIGGVTPAPDYQGALADVTASTGEIVPALLAAAKLTSVRTMRPAVQAVADRLLVINGQFRP